VLPVWEVSHSQQVALEQKAEECKETSEPGRASLLPHEWSLVLFAVLVFGLPTQALDALAGVIILRLSTIFLGVLTVVGGLALLVFLLLKLRQSAQPKVCFSGRGDRMVVSK
jgi:hypothetical protein